MKTLVYSLLFAVANILLFSCKESTPSTHNDHDKHEHEAHTEQVILKQSQITALGAKIDTLQHRQLNGYVKANGFLEVPPQNEASVTAVRGGNIVDIQVIEGDNVPKGFVLAYLEHPDLIRLQTDYIEAWEQLQFLSQKVSREQTLNQQKVSSSEQLQSVETEYRSQHARVSGLEAELALLNISNTSLQAGNILQRIPVKTPIPGSVSMIHVKTGQYVSPKDVLFELVNTDDIHADLMVFEQDAHKVKKGQRIAFRVESLPDKELHAIIYSIGKTFEENPKALHIHADIENKEGLLLPGMYVRGKIWVENKQVLSIPREGLVQESEAFYIFKQDHVHGNNIEFKPIRVVPGVEDDGWVQVTAIDNIKPNDRFAHTSAYFILAEWKKSEAEHSH
jgi:cobalt-zinc-cadmium efflux system membrane fusion protein